MKFLRAVKLGDSPTYIIRIDPHVHTVYSLDSLITLDDIQKVLRSGLLSHIGITDHNTVLGGIKAFKNIGRPILPGIELSSQEGHILLLGIKDKQLGKRIEALKGKSSLEILDIALDENLLPLIPHPLELRRHGVDESTLRCILDKYPDIPVESLNASSLFYTSRKKLLKILSTSNLNPRLVASSDAHITKAIGCAFTYVLSFNNSEDPLDMLLSAPKMIPYGSFLPIGTKLEIFVKQTSIKLRRLCYHFRSF